MKIVEQSKIKSKRPDPLGSSNAKAHDDLFDSLSKGGKTIDPGTYPGVVKQLPDGTFIRRRPDSKSGAATIDITFPDGTNTKFHIK